MVKRINSYRFSKGFRKQYNALPHEIRQTFNEKLTLFLADMLHPSLRVKKIQGTHDRWEGSVTMKYRFTFHFDSETVIFRAIGTHDILSRESS
jgi:mRNA-degrading endonuclease RelE of RelBE toxin-antitoxin system